MSPNLWANSPTNLLSSTVIQVGYIHILVLSIPDKPQIKLRLEPEFYISCFLKSYHRFLLAERIITAYCSIQGVAEII